MLVCPACDSPNEDRAHRCVRCGAALLRSPDGDTGPGTRRMGRTMLGVAPLLQEPQQERHVPIAPQQGGFTPFESAPATLTGPNPNRTLPLSIGVEGQVVEQNTPQTVAGIADPKARTLMGFGPISGASKPPPRSATDEAPSGDSTTEPALAGQTPTPSADAHPKAALKGTLMGVAPFIAPQESGAAAGQPVALEASALGTTVNISGRSPLRGSADGESAGDNRLNKTMLGVAPPVPTSANSPPAREPPGQLGEPPGVNPAVPQHKGTLLGVAMPGIAPLNPGLQKPNAPPGAGSAFEQPERLPYAHRATPTPVAEQRHAAATAAALVGANRVALQRAVQRKRLAWILGSASSILVAIITIAALVWWNSVHLTVKVGTSEANEEQLLLSCSNCPNGTTVSLQGKTASFGNGHAELQLAKRLTVGLNQLSLEIKRPNRTRGEVVNASVPIEFRVTSDLSGLTNDPPQLLVVVEAVPQTRIQISGRTLTVGTDGKLVAPVDVTPQLLGTSAGRIPFEHKLDYVVIQSDGTQIPGSLVARMGITPLEIAMPGLDYVTANATFTLAGRTSPKAKLTANGHPLTVFDDGTFRQDMALSAPGATRLRVRTLEDGLAPRMVDIALERVTNLRQRAEELGRSLYTTYDAITELVTTKPNSLVALHGEIVAVDSSELSTRVVVSASCVHTPCMASVRHGAPVVFAKGTRIIAIGRGRLTKRATSSERDLTIDSSLIIEESPR